MNGCNEALQDKTPGILLLTHGGVGEELIKSAEMIIGPMVNVSALSLMPGMSPENFLVSVSGILDNMPEGSLIISDLFGGTPANISAAVSQTKNISAVSGLSICMLIEAASLRTTLRGEKLAEAVVEAGKKGCKNILVALREIE